MLRKPRRWRIPSDVPSSGDEARRAVTEAVHRLGDALAQQREVDEVHRFLSRVERENRLVPKISAALGAHRD